MNYSESTWVGHLGSFAAKCRNPVTYFWKDNITLQFHLGKAYIQVVRPDCFHILIHVCRKPALPLN